MGESYTCMKVDKKIGLPLPPVSSEVSHIQSRKASKEVLAGRKVSMEEDITEGLDRQAVFAELALQQAHAMHGTGCGNNTEWAAGMARQEERAQAHAGENTERKRGDDAACRLRTAPPLPLLFSLTF